MNLLFGHHIVILKLRKGNIKSFFPLWIIHKFCLASFSFKSQLLAGPIKSGVQQSGHFRFDTKQFWRNCKVFWLIDLLLLLIYLWEKDIQNIPIFVPSLSAKLHYTSCLDGVWIKIKKSLDQSKQFSWKFGSIQTKADQTPTKREFSLLHVLTQHNLDVSQKVRVFICFFLVPSFYVAHAGHCKFVNVQCFSVF